MPMMPGPAARLKKLLIFIHRWMGVGLCLLFAMWFSSGMVLMYWDYPSVSAADRLDRAPALDPLEIRLSPEQAYLKLATSEPPTGVRVETLDQRPAYKFRFGAFDRIVYADNGQEQSDFTPEFTLRTAAAWTRQPPATAKAEELTAEDQWTVSGEFSALRPLRKYSWPDGEQVYVSIVTGEVAQYTTRASRTGAYFGAIPHWLYFTALRKHGQQWTQLVIWTSGLGTVAVLLGIAIGVWVFSPAKQYSRAGVPSSIPYSGQKWWHAVLGLIFGICACTWAFSGMLSMDPFPQWQEGSSEAPDATLDAPLDAALAAALRGSPLLDAFAGKSPQEALVQAQGRAGGDFQAKQLELISFAGEPFYLAMAASHRTRIIPVHGTIHGEPAGESASEFSQDQIANAIRDAAGPATLTEIRRVTEYEAYYLDRKNQLPLPVIFAQLNDQARSTYYIDPQTARIVQTYNSHSRWNRWLYHGLHSLNFPWLYKHRPAWDIVMLSLMLGGASLSVTAIILAWRVVRRTVS
jgi:PepSY-associated transmembrane protein